MKTGRNINKHPWLRCFPIWLHILVLIMLCTCDNAPEPRNIELESPHFRILATTKTTTDAEIKAIRDIGEDLLEKIAAFLGPERLPSEKITIRLEGNFTGQGPYFDAYGIHLFRYSVEEGGYFATLAHEMVHAFNKQSFIDRETWTWPSFGFFDEGLAEYVAQKVDSGKTGFPFYGYPEDIVAGDLVAQEQFIPFDTLRRHHEALNQKCMLQTYPQRTSWMRHIDEEFGRDTLLALYYSSLEPVDSVVRTITGLGLHELDVAWHDWIAARYAQIPGAAETSASFRLHTSWYGMCREGVEF